MTSAPTDLDLLFTTDPRTHTDAQRRELIIELRRRRSVFHSEEAAKAAKPSKEKAPRPAVPVAPGLSPSEIDLNDL